MTQELKYINLPDPSAPEKARQLAYYEYGTLTNSKVVLCVHGLSRNGLDFEWLAQKLASDYRVIVPDMAGRGQSDWLANKDAYNYATYIADILGLIKELKLTNFDWVGTSMGGIIGMMLGAQYPDFIKKMVLNDVGSIVSAKGLKRIIGYVGGSSIFNSKDEAMAHLKTIIALFGISTDAEWEQAFKVSFTALPDGKYSFAYDPEISKPFKETALKGGEINDIDLSPLWNAIKCPVLILRGAISDILTHETAVAMSKRKATKLIEFDGVGHAPALLNEKQITIIKDWLATD